MWAQRVWCCVTDFSSQGALLEYLVTHKRRSTPRAQTSAAPNLRNVKQSIHAWNSLPENVSDCSLFRAGPTIEISRTSVCLFSHNVANRQTDKGTEMKTWSRRSAEVIRIQSPPPDGKNQIILYLRPVCRCLFIPTDSFFCVGGVQGVDRVLIVPEDSVSQRHRAHKYTDRRRQRQCPEAKTGQE